MFIIVLYLHPGVRRDIPGRKGREGGGAGSLLDDDGIARRWQLGV